MGRRDGPELPSAEIAHVEAAIACSAEGRSLIVCPVLSRHTIGRKALPLIIPVAVAPCVQTAVHTGATELVLGANRESLQSDLIRAQLGPIAHSQQKNRKGRSGWVLLGTADRLMPKWPRMNDIGAVLTIAKLIPQFQTYLADN